MKKLSIKIATIILVSSVTLISVGIGIKKYTEGNKETLNYAEKTIYESPIVIATQNEVKEAEAKVDATIEEVKKAEDQALKAELEVQKAAEAIENAEAEVQEATKAVEKADTTLKSNTKENAIKINCTGDHCGKDYSGYIWFAKFECDFAIFNEPGSAKLTNDVIIGRRGDITSWTQYAPTTIGNHTFERWEKSNYTYTASDGTTINMIKYKAIYK